MFIIGIAGGTGSGKTTVARRIVKDLSAEKAVLLSLDSYYKDSSHVPFEDRQKINFDHPDAFDWPLLIEQLRELKEGRSVESPTYEFVTSSRTDKTVHVDPCEVLVLEGILTFANQEVCDLLDLKIFVDTDADVRLIRLIQRDVVERGRTAQAVMERYTRVLKPMHQQFVEPTKALADFVMSGEHNEIAVSTLTEYINKKA